MYLPALLSMMLLATPLMAAEKKGAAFVSSASQLPFATLCLDSKISTETAYTLAKLIHASRYEFTTQQFPEDAFRNVTRKNAKALVAKLTPESVYAIASHLEKKTWLHLEGDKIADLRPLTGLSNLTGLVLSHHSISDLTPLAGLVNLKRLDLEGNQIADLNPLEKLVNLQELTLYDNPLISLQTLGHLPKLAELELSAGHVHLLAGVQRLDALKKLTARGIGPSSFIATPRCPELISLRAEGLTSLDGMEKFPSLLYASLTGVYTSLKPLNSCPQLTHLRISSFRTVDASEIKDLPAIKAIDFSALQVKNLESLGSHPTLREVTMPESKGTPVLQLKLLHASLSSWDADFSFSEPRATPSPKLLVVSQDEFDRFDFKEGYGVTPADRNIELIESERAWLERRLTKILAAKWEKTKDWNFPYTGGLRRSHTLHLSSVKAYQAAPQIVAAIQKELATARNDWIIYLQVELWGSDADRPVHATPDFIAWIYPDKIVTTENYAETIRKLFKP
ncbi:MAG TPA: leucine-rich repeat domain-containing protein [Verrucomicrobiae bacterium]